MPLCSRPRRNRNDSMMKMNFEYNKLLFHKTESYQTLKNTDISTTKHSCKTVSLSDLNPILLKDLLVPHVHHGKYLLCRTITYSFTIVGVLTLVEDLNDDVEELALYHFQKSLIDDPNTWLPPGTILIIKEPYLKYASSQGQTVILRCDSPSDVIFVDECNEELLKGTKWYQKCTLSFDQLKVKGNTYYSSEDYGNALKFYDRALKISPDHPVILLNKSAAFLMLERYYEAHQSALKAFQSENPLVNKEKILIRLARSAYGMRNWKLSVDYYSSLLNLDGTNQIVIEEIQQAKQRYEESTSGKYNLYHIMDEYIRSLATQKPLFFDVADYSGPIEITDIVGKGKGLVASADIPKGTLLIGSKAFSLSYNPQDDFILIPRDFFRKLILRKTAYLNITKTIQTLKNNPHRASELYSLYSYSYDRKEIIEDSIIDTGRIEEICLFNSFQPQEILFPFSNLSAETEPKNIIDDKSPTGLWILPSFLNHSCIGNSNRIFYGDFMMVYAIKDLIKGEEITFSYVPVDSYFDRNKAIQSFYKFSCTCSLCNEEKNDKSYSQREKLLQENSQIINLFDKGQLQESISKGISLVRRIRNTYKNKNLKYRLQLAEPLKYLGLSLKNSGKGIEAIEKFREALNCDNFTFQCQLIMLFSIFAVYCQMINIKEACSVLIEIYEFLHIHIGIDSSTFMLIYKKEVADLKLESFFDNHIHQIILQEFNLLIKNT